MTINTDNVILVIPAYNPDHKLTDLLTDLIPKWHGPILVVDDGSEDKTVFKEIPKIRVKQLVHYVNMGKGRALKTAFNYGLDKYPHAIGFVQVDCDGKYVAKDVLNIAEKLEENPNKLVLGMRDLDSENLPYEMKWGYKFFTKVMNLTFDLDIHDSQSGLRAIPREYAIACLNIPGDRYEFDVNVLLNSKNNDVDIIEEQIETIYIEEDKETHFKPLIESIHVANAIIRFAASSGACSILDLFLYSFFSTGVFTGSYSILLATFSARLISSTLSFLINRKMVFKADKGDIKTKEKFFLLEVGIMVSSAVFVYLLSLFIPLPSLIIKLFVDFMLWFANYYIQRTWVFG